MFRFLIRHGPFKTTKIQETYGYTGFLNRHGLLPTTIFLLTQHFKWYNIPEQTIL